MLAGKRILLIVTGGIAAYKALELVRRLREQGASVRAVLTAGGARFVTPLSLAAITGLRKSRSKSSESSIMLPRSATSEATLSSAPLSRASAHRCGVHTH